MLTYFWRINSADNYCRWTNVCPFLCMKATPGCDAARRSLLGPNRRIVDGGRLFSDQGHHYRDPQVGVWGAGCKPLGNLPEGHFHLHSNFQPSSDPYLEVSTLGGLWLALLQPYLRPERNSVQPLLPVFLSGLKARGICQQHCLMVLTLLLKTHSICHIKSAGIFPGT